MGAARVMAEVSPRPRAFLLILRGWYKSAADKLNQKLHPGPSARATRKRNRPTVLEERGDESPGEILLSPAQGNQTRHLHLDIFPQLELVVVRPGDDVAVRQDGDAPDLRPSRRRRAIDRAV